jgi:fluoroquinolone resistance protein
MDTDFTESETFERIDFRAKPLKKGEYEECIFSECDFSDSDLSDIKFIECEFVSCNLSLVKLTGTLLIDTRFKDCKMLGLHFDDCSEAGLSFMFENCNLSHCSFFKRNLKKTTFRNSKLEEADFTETVLSGSLFDGCDLTSATFDDTNLEKVDFRTSVNYSIDPEKNYVRNAKFSLQGIKGLLGKYDIDIDD